MYNRFYQRRVRVLTILGDIFAINVAFMLAYYVRYSLQWIQPVTFAQPYIAYLGQQMLFTLLIVLVFQQTRVWVRKRGEFWIDEFSRASYSILAAMAMMVFITFFIQPLVFSRLLLVWLLIFSIALIGLARLLRRSFLSILYRRNIGVDNVILVGSGEVARSVLRTLLARPDLGFKAIGYLDNGDRGNKIGSGRIPHLGSWEDLPLVLEEKPETHTVFIALPIGLQEITGRIVRMCQAARVNAQVVPDLFELSLSRVEFNNMGGIPTFGIRDLRISSIGRVLKRVIDLVIVSIGTIPSLVVGGLIALAIKMDSPGPVFFEQVRVGKGGEEFVLYKFRSMVENAEAMKDDLMEQNEATGPLFKMKDDPRRTRVGTFLRKTSLDELPQLINVAKGEMSLVGPRPPLPDEVAEYKPWHKQRLSVTGGITGLWQVSGRSDLTFDEQCLLDIYYIENWSLTLDMRLLLQTIPHALFGRGAY